MEAHMALKQSMALIGLAAAAIAPLAWQPTSTALAAVSTSTAAAATSMTCDVSHYKAAPGLTAVIEQDSLAVSWAGQNNTDVRARYAIDGGQPVVREIAIKRAGGSWTTLGRNLTPEYHVVSGVRRLADGQANALRTTGGRLTDEVINKNRWYAFWDAPLVMPGSQEMKDEAAWRRSQQTGEGRGGRGEAQNADPLVPNRTLGTPRTPSEIRRADASFRATSCRVKTDGASLIVTFPGLSMGIFSGNLQFTVYKGTNLLRMDAAATTNEPGVA